MATARIIRTVHEARQLLKSPDASSDRVDQNLEKYETEDRDEKRRFAEFLRSWPMYNEGSVHRDSKSAIVKAMHRSMSHSAECNSAIAGTVRTMATVDTDQVRDLNDGWQARFMGLDGDDYASIAPLFSQVTDFFANRSNTYSFRTAMNAIDVLREFVAQNPFIPDSFMSECVRVGLSTDVLVSLLVDARPSVHRALQALFHCRCTWPADDIETIDPLAAAQLILLRHPPFGMINRLELGEDNRAQAQVGIDIFRCNGDAAMDPHYRGTGITFGFGRHGCPAADPVTDLLAQVWSATIAGWPTVPASYRHKTSSSGSRLTIEQQSIVVGSSH